MVSDVEQLRDLLHPDVTWLGFPGDDATPICRSKEEARARLTMRSAHPEILEQSEERVVVRVHLDAPSDGVDLHQVLTMRDGLVWLIEDYPERP